MDMFWNVADSWNICLSWQKAYAKALLSGFSAKKILGKDVKKNQIVAPT